MHKGRQRGEGVLDLGILPCRVCIGRRSGGASIPTYKGVLDSGVLPCRVCMGRRSEKGGGAYLPPKPFNIPCISPWPTGRFTQGTLSA